ncbi:MAG: polysaccharide biosynthesis protein [Holophagaceae bacterium]|nr:polysaccharide biosynthesis protein [Holophagaceae bacterium]
MRPNFHQILEHPRLRRGVKLGLDLSISALAWSFSERAFSASHPTPGGLWKWIALALVVNVILQLTRQHYRLIGFRDAVRIFVATLVLLSASALIANTAGWHHIYLDPKTAIAAAFSTGGGWLCIRGFFRARNDWHFGINDPQGPTGIDDGSQRHRTLIIGAGKAGLLVSQEMIRHPALGCRVIGFLDDATDKQGLKIHGIPILGTTQQLESVIGGHGISQVILAMPTAPGTVIRQLSEVARACSMEVKTVPGISDLLGPKNWKPELRDISIEDLLRRDPIELDQPSINEVLGDSVVLITGGGGSIGGELARQVTTFRPSRIVLLGRGENSLWDIERSLRAQFPNQGISIELCDIRNMPGLMQAFKRWNPDVVFHAAAHKHVPFLEAHPEEGVGNNIFGTKNVLDAALAAGIRTFVNISTDKAVNPTNVLGATKRIAEQLVLFAAADAPPDCRYMSVRFGNVLGSRGSVIPIFKEQILKGGPLTVTHQDMTRYFMTIPEASQLVLQAGILGDTGKVYALDMGSPVRIMDLASDMIKLSGLVLGQDLDIEFTGIRPGEKLFEEIFADGEPTRTNVHPKVFEADPEPCSRELLDSSLAILSAALALPEGQRQSEILKELQKLVPTYKPSMLGLGRYAKGARSRRSRGTDPFIRP